MKRNRLTLIIVGIVIAGLAAVAFTNFKHHGSILPQAKYKEITGYGDGTYDYECSKPIKGKLGKADWDIPGATGYFPVDPDEARLYCYANGAIEYKGKIKVLQKPEVQALISKYQYKDVTIKALEFKYIKDKEYVHRLLPMYQDIEIGCIIVINTPGEDKVYLEDEKLNTFKEMDYQAFNHQLEQVAPADRQLFYDNLK